MAKRKMNSNLDPYRLVGDKQVRKTMRLLIDDGWTFVRLSSSQHPILQWPKTGDQISLPLTPSDHRGLRNALSTARHISGIDHRP
ncbi:hypothetical protein ABIE52_006781 [Rhodococcus sp. OAS809]|uniref:hypothetical protein n=1 Tax=Rhodococcus sp. OAS809 TaxID=2663874 RepID=UPI00178ABE2D